MIENKIQKQKICPFCKTPLTEDDNVVVCSMCEMPHHKECWVENGACTTFGCMGTISNEMGEVMTFEERPSPNSYSSPSNSSSSSIPSTPSVAENNIFCTACGAKNLPEFKFCIKCGSQLVAWNPLQQAAPVVSYQAAPVASRQTQVRYEATLEEKYKLFVGSNTQYYMPKFALFDNTQEETSWNWAAFFLSVYWMIYRKMYALAAAMLTIIFVIGFLPTPFPLLAGLGIGIYAGLYGNHKYYEKAKTTIDEANDFDTNKAHTVYMEKGGVTIGAAIGVLIGFSIFQQLILLGV